MRIAPRLRPLIPTAALAALALFLVPEDVRAAAKVPTLASTPQYKAFASYVTKLKRLEGKPATAAQKATYETELTSKHRAAVNRSTALFNRARSAAKSETQGKFRAAAREVREDEASELADLRAEYGEKLIRAEEGYKRNLIALADSYDVRAERLHKQIRTLRMRKANANGLARKTQIQQQINVIVQQLNDSEEQERKAIRKLKERYREQKAVIQEAKSKATAAAREDRQTTVENLRSRWNRVYNGKAANLQAKRQRQLADLEAKLNAGRTSVSLMPVSG